MLPTSLIEETEHLWIPMPDGVKLAARLWKPNLSDHQKYPAIFEYIPYRKADMVRARDERNHPFFAEQGFACLRVDMRGSGDSEGQMPDMYCKAELADARHVINWIADQEWCDGSVGMFGTSWGGTASLQASIDAPKALKAVIAVCATHDRYEDDIHHMGGCLLTDTIEWGATLPNILASPPTPDAGSNWMDMWKSRLDNLSFPLELWIKQEARGDYWRHGSIIHQIDKLSCPVLAIGGWSDRYSNSVMNLVDARPDNCWGIVGPWGHHYPDQGHPGPAIGFQHVALEWWKHWLVKENQKVSSWPKLRAWMMEWDEPEDFLDKRSGSWIESSPAKDVTDRTCFFLQEALLVPGRDNKQTHQLNLKVPNDLEVGQSSGDTGYFGRFGGLPLDQSLEDQKSLCFETGPFTNDLNLYGSPELTLSLAQTEPISQLAIRINDVSPNGVSNRVLFMVHNLALDGNFDEPENGSESKSKEVTIKLNTRAYRFKKDHKLKLSISTSYWPLVWPSPQTADIMIHSGHLSIPTIDIPTKLSEPFPPPQSMPKRYEQLTAPKLERFQSTSSSGELYNGWHQPYISQKFTETGVVFGYETKCDQSLHINDPNSATCRFHHRMVFDRTDGKAEIVSQVQVTSDEKNYKISGNLVAYWEGEVLAEHNWNPSIERKYS